MRAGGWGHLRKAEPLLVSSPTTSHRPISRTNWGAPSGRLGQIWPEGNSIAWVIIQFMRLSNGVSRAREPGASAAPSRKAQPLPAPPPRLASAQTLSPHSGALHLQSSPLVLPADRRHPWRAADLWGESQQTGARSATCYGDKVHVDAQVPPAPANHPGFALLAQSKAASETPIPKGSPHAPRTGIPKLGRGPDLIQVTEPGTSQPRMLPALPLHVQAVRYQCQTPRPRLGGDRLITLPCRRQCVPWTGPCHGERRAGSSMRPCCTRLP